MTPRGALCTAAAAAAAVAVLAIAGPARAGEPAARSPITPTDPPTAPAANPPARVADPPTPAADPPTARGNPPTARVAPTAAPTYLPHQPTAPPAAPTGLPQQPTAPLATPTDPPDPPTAPPDPPGLPHQPTAPLATPTDPPDPPTAPPDPPGLPHQPTSPLATPTDPPDPPTTTPDPPDPPTAPPAPAPSTAQAAPPPPAAATEASAAAREAGKPAPDDDGEPKLSLPTQADRVAWRNSGFRLALGLVYGRMVGLRGAPSGRLLGPIVRVGLRLDERWSLLASFQYAAASESGGLSGLRFAGTIDPTWHVTPSLSVALGFGFGGIVEGRTGRPDAMPLPSAIETSYTFPDARTPVASCSGVGVAGLARVEWAFVLGPRTQTSVALEAIGQWTGCVDDTNRIEPDTGTAIVRRQWWPHTGVTLGWGIAWR